MDSKCESLQTPHVSPKHRRGTAHDWPSSRLAFRHPFQSFERVRVFANEQHQCGGLRIGFSAALFPFLQSSFVDPQLARKNRSRTMQPLARVADQLRINLGERRWINFVAAQVSLPSRWAFIAARPSISSPKTSRWPQSLETADSSRLKPIRNDKIWSIRGAPCLAGFARRGRNTSADDHAAGRRILICRIPHSLTATDLASP